MDEVSDLDDGLDERPAGPPGEMDSRALAGVEMDFSTLAHAVNGNTAVTSEEMDLRVLAGAAVDLSTLARAVDGLTAVAF